MPKKTFRVFSSDIDKRLDVFLSEKEKQLSRSQVQKMIREGKAKVLGKRRKSGYRLREGERIEFDFEFPKIERPTPEKISLNIVFEDDHLIVLDKPSGMIVHPGAGNAHPTLADGLLFFFPEIAKVGPVERPGIVHRLDKETSGLIVVAKTEKAYLSLRRQFRERQVEKSYLGLAWGKISRAKGSLPGPSAVTGNMEKECRSRPKSPVRQRRILKL